MSSLIPYIQALENRLEPAEIRVELDNPQSQSQSRVQDLEQTAATVDTASERRGKGAAITAGFDALTTDIRMFLDADGATPVESAATILERLDSEKIDVSVGSRRHPDSTTIVHHTVLRRYLGDGFSRLARTFLPVRMYDYQCGAKALSAEAWRQVRVHLYEEGFAWDLELLAIADSVGLNITEVPIKWEDKPGSTVDPVSTVVDFLRALITVRHRALAIQGHPIHSAVHRKGAQTLVSDD